MRFFIDHPVSAIVLNLMIILIGIMCFNKLSLIEYPKIDIPVISIQTNYPNASALLIENSVTNVLEDSIAGVEGIENISSVSKENSSRITITFKPGTNTDKAVSMLRDAIDIAYFRLPKDIFKPVIERASKQTNGPPFMFISIVSDNMDSSELTHFTNLYIKNSIRSVTGISSVDVWGEPYVMNISVSPLLMYRHKINSSDITNAILENNIAYPVGKFMDITQTTMNNIPINVSDFSELIINGNIPLKYIADVSLETDRSQMRYRINGNNGTMLAVYIANDGNPINTSNLIKEKVLELQKTLPNDVKIDVILDLSDFIRNSIKNIQSSIFEAIMLVLIIVYLFLKNIKMTIVPLITIPISLIGTFILLFLFGFSLNIMTLLGMVIAVGLVVDDAIVVVENIQRHIKMGKNPYDASIEGIKEITFPIICMTITLAIAYVPVIFMDGILGRLFLEFAVALSGSVIISGITAITLSPYMCMYFNKNTNIEKNENYFVTYMSNVSNVSKKFIFSIQQLITPLFKQLFSFINNFLDKKPYILWFIYFLSIILSFYIFISSAKIIAPKEDRGLLGAYIQPISDSDVKNGSSKIDEMEKIIEEIEKIMKTDEAKTQYSLIGDWGGNCILELNPKRKRSSEEIKKSFVPKLNQISSVDVWPWSYSSSLPGLQTFGGIQLTISGNKTFDELFKFAEQTVNSLNKKNIFADVRHDLTMNNKSYNVKITDKRKLKPFDIAKTIEMFFSGDKSMMFQKDGLSYLIKIKGNNESPSSLYEMYALNDKGKMISIADVCELQEIITPTELKHNNQSRSFNIIIEKKPNQGINEAMDLLWKSVDAKDLKKEWSSESKLNSNTSIMWLFFMAILFIYLILSIQFDNFLDPITIISTVPLSTFGGLIGVFLFGNEISIYTQVGLITLVGLITKHGILIVEFSNNLLNEGMFIDDAIKAAINIRLRPIIMTTAAMVIGSIPLIISGGAGSEARKDIGIVLLSGLLLGTIFTLYILPLIYKSLKIFSIHIK